MAKMSRRKALVGLTGAVVAVAIVRAEVSDTIVVEDGKSTKSSVIRAENHDTNNLGKGAEYNSLSAQLSVWFGNATGRYLPDYLFEDWPFSVVIFHKTAAMDAVVESAVKNYFASLPLPIEKSMAREMTSDGKIRIKIYGGRI